MSADAVAVVVVTYDSSAHVEETLAALTYQLRDDDELVIVDNGSRDATVPIVRATAPRARVLEQRRNLGFAGGACAGVDATTAPLVLLLNPDARPAAGCLDALRAAANERPGWAAWQVLVTMYGGGAINTAWNVAYFPRSWWVGLSWETVVDAPSCL